MAKVAFVACGDARKSALQLSCTAEQRRHRRQLRMDGATAWNVEVPQRRFWKYYGVCCEWLKWHSWLAATRGSLRCGCVVLRCNVVTDTNCEWTSRQLGTWRFPKGGFGNITECVANG